MTSTLLRKPETALTVATPVLATALAFATPTPGQPPGPEGTKNHRTTDHPSCCACFTALVGLAVVRRRDAVHLRQGALAARMEVHITRLSRFESGLGPAFSGPLDAACRALGCTPADVLAEARQYAALLGDHGYQVVEHPGKVSPGHHSVESWELPSFLLGLAVEAYRPRAALVSNTPGEGA